MLDPQARALLDLMEARGVPATHTQTPAEARKFYRERRFFTQPDPAEVGELRALRIPGPTQTLAARLYRPLRAAQQAGELPVLVYFHGGGWTIGDLDTHDSLCRQLANGSGCAVVAVDYRLAPEHAFPAAVDDCVAATRWVQQHAAGLGLDARRIGVGGDSAGGNLAAVVALTLRDAARGGASLPLRLQLLVYPATDMRALAPSHTHNGEGFLLTRESIAYFRGHYLPDRSLETDWRASPALCQDLRDLPPAFVLTAGFDPLRDEGREYADLLSAAGNAVQYVCFERQIHGFITMGRVLDEARTAVELCAQVVRRALQG